MAGLKPATVEFGGATNAPSKSEVVTFPDGAVFQEPFEKRVEPPVQSSTFGNHWKNTPPQEFQKVMRVPTRQQCTQKQQSGGLNLTPTESVVSQRAQQAKKAGQNACSVIGPK